MSESNIPENFLPFMSAGVAVNRVLFADPHHNAGCLVRPAPTWQGDTRGGECSCWNCRSNQWGTAEAATRDSNRQEDGPISQAESDEEEELEAPLPLRDEHEWNDFDPSRLPHRFMHICHGGHDAGEGQSNHSPANTYFTPPHQHFAVNQQHRRHWDEPQHCLQLCGSLTRGAVSVNVPQFSVPPAEGVSQVSVLNLAPAGGNSSTSRPQERRRTISLTEECRKVFITYSSDVSSEMLSFVDFLTKQGLRPAIDLLDDPFRNMDINKWNDSNLKDPLTLIIVAISPKYKADIEGSVMDSKALHNKYIHSMMQGEFIQQGSLNFRFIPVLFNGASQKFVPTWLQNTRVYRWPQDTEDLSLRLLREERYVPPPVPVDLTLLITPS